MEKDKLLQVHDKSGIREIIQRAKILGKIMIFPSSELKCNNYYCHKGPLTV